MEKQAENSKKPTKIFMVYAINMLLRVALFGYAIFLLFTNPDQLDFTQHFSLFSEGITFVDIVFVFFVLDMLTKMFPNAKIAIGSKKQYKQHWKVTKQMISNAPKELQSLILDIKADGTIIFQEAVKNVKTTIANRPKSAEEIIARLREMKAPKNIRQKIRHDRLREIIPVAIFWIVFNAAAAIILWLLGLLLPDILMIWALFYFLFDMVCVVLWCPLQLIFMKNRCCTTCHIFNWDAIMAVTPLVFAIACPFSIILLSLATIVLLRWEIAVARHPERFSEKTNANLKCCNCKDKLCYIRKPLLVSNLDKHIPDKPRFDSDSVLKR